IRFDDLKAQLEQLDGIYQAKGIIVDERGMVVASTIENVLPQTNISSADTQMKLKNAIEQPDQFIEGVIDGNPRILMAKKVDIGSQKEWYMISSIDP
ncbi:methyl-accepting chemotaxis protein, partial [Vibrio sp. 10N.222.54.F6]